MNLSVVTIGDVAADLVISIPRLPVCANEHQMAHEMFVEAGAVGNFLIIAARLGLQASPLGSVADDLYGRRVLELLAGEGVNVGNVVVQEGKRTTVAIVLVDDQGQHVFLGVKGDGEPVPWQPAWRTLIQRSGAVFTSGYAVREISALSSTAVLKALEVAREHGVSVFFDLTPEIAHVKQEQLELVLGQTTVLLATLDEAAFLTGARPTDEVARHLLAQGPRLVIPKLGAEGCVMATAEDLLRLEAIPVVMRDTTGAGDAFDAACVYAYLKGFSLEQMAVLANAVGAATVTKLGTGTRLPTKEDIKSLLRGSAVAEPL